ncbi:MAG: thermophilic metalloprotease (M29) superfamily [Candidatus Zambryskibacteria bacterium CG10_big_fil_rev_8_21_14_0_10_42_12]|uniref:Thermophilic metalloprotease (M29) superfamily n=1 Tax=Candidatus Zambryskibacteria bacterium CG10_big_fil_rev_8_21_14_0_10_42_12 TaxID=1975115 RepID=A0A2H0QVR7_9BACT|nr:MAG: thermophilic metalloprotease (M29) superfamily [Candidatus Zambryskibacteria bacterium CG10_big_fil_rev_8_21_14_0_10_42_12]
MSFTPSQKTLERYADVLVNFAIGHGKGIKKGDVVRVVANEATKPLYKEIRKAILKAGGHIIPFYQPDDTKESNFSEDFFTLASEDQLSFFPKTYMKGLVDQVDHSITVWGDTYPEALKKADPKKLLMHEKARKHVYEWFFDKENKGKYSWTGALYGTEAMAKEAGLDLTEYWSQIIKACFLDETNPVAKWKQVDQEIKSTAKKLDKLNIQKVHLEGPDMSLDITIGDKRKWVSGGGANIPSFEIFTSPDWRGTNGRIKFNQPLYRYGNLIKGIELEFRDGIVVKSKAKKNEKLLKEMIATEGANKVGEFSLTDTRFSRITKFMAETLYDENMGGPHGNTHIALGSSYHETYTGDRVKMKQKDWQKLGFNDSSVHTDIISTTPRTVTATLKNGTEKVIYKDGMFTV